VKRVRAVRLPLMAAALAGFLVLVQFYTSLASLSPTPSVGYVFAGPAAASALVAGLVAAAAICLRGLLARGTPSGPSRSLLAFWIGAAALSALAGLDPLAGLAVVGMMLLGAAFHLALVRFYDRPPVAAWVVSGYLWCGLAAAVAGIVMVLARRPALLWSLNHGRAAGFFVTANQFAAFLVMFVFVALGAALATPSPKLRRLAWSGAAAGSVALGLTFSAAGWLGALAGGIFFCYALGARRAALAALAAGVLALSFIALRPALGHHNPAEASSRARTWQAGLRVAQLFPLSGVGPMGYWRVYPAVRAPDGDPPGSFGALHPHDVWLSLAGELGAAGLAAALYGWWRFAGFVRGELRDAPKVRRSFALGICAGFVAVLVQGIFDTVGVVEMTFVWIPMTALGLAAATHGLGER